jgi:hypothetical protein
MCRRRAQAARCRYAVMFGFPDARHPKMHLLVARRRIQDVFFSFQLTLSKRHTTCGRPSTRCCREQTYFSPATVDLHCFTRVFVLLATRVRCLGLASLTFCFVLSRFRFLKRNHKKLCLGTPEGHVSFDIGVVFVVFTFTHSLAIKVRPFGFEFANAIDASRVTLPGAVTSLIQLQQLENTDNNADADSSSPLEIKVISIIGGYRLGKSFCSTPCCRMHVNPQTTAVCAVLLATNVLLVDTPGLFAPTSNEARDAALVSPLMAVSQFECAVAQRRCN